MGETAFSTPCSKYVDATVSLNTLLIAVYTEPQARQLFTLYWHANALLATEPKQTKSQTAQPQRRSNFRTIASY